MIIEPKIKEIYKKIQKRLFYMIPEKWDRIYLYASIFEEKLQEKGEMFFYYFPKGFLRKKPINVYEVPSRFNIDEEDYIKLAKSLFKEIKKLRELSIELGEKEWSNLTIVIENFKFRVEYSYDSLSSTEFSNYERHLIWRYKYLKTPIESFSRQDKAIIERYIINDISIKKQNKKVYEEPIYAKPVPNIIDYDTEKIDIENKKEYIEKNKGRSQILNFKTDIN